jgi:hypothetical protein
MAKITNQAQKPVPLLEAIWLEVSCLSNIPANEQSLGIMQGAIQSILEKLVIELEYIERRLEGFEKRP